MKEISGVNNTGGFGGIQPKLTQTPARQQTATVPPARPGDLHIGDIVQGKVLEMLSDDKASVELPSGTIDAFVSANLRAGDELFFQVKFLTPLGLAPHAVSSGLLQSARTKDILRMLSLPDTTVHEEVANVLKNAKSLVSRDEIVKIALAYSQLLESNMPQVFLSEFSSTEMMRVFLAMQQHGIPLMPRSFRRVADALRDTKKIEENFLSHFQKLIENLPDEIAGKLRKILERLGNEQSPLSESLKFFSMERGIEYNFFEMIEEIISWSGDPEKQRNFSLNIAAAERIMLMLEAQQIVNLYALQYSAQMYFVIPLLYEGRLRFIQLILRRRGSGKKSSLIEFLLRIATDEYGEVAVNGSLHSVRITGKIFSSEENFSSAINLRLSELKQALEKNYFYVQSLSVNENPDEMPPPSTPESFEFVI